VTRSSSARVLDFVTVRARFLDDCGCGDYVTPDLLGGPTWCLAAELIEHAVEQSGAMLMNQADFVSAVEHRLSD
jgi:hypothetical protein